MRPMFKRILSNFLVLCFVLIGALRAGDVRPEWERSLLDDATLRDVTFVGQHGWAVGEHGAIRRTKDGGRTWTLEQAPRSASLRSVCFLTNRIGWVAGGFVEPYTQAERGVLFVTRDGGETWEDLTSNDLPYLHKIKFFSLETGIAVGHKLGPYGSGLLTTEDGGATWIDSSSEAEIESAWRTGDFLTPERGVIAGREGALSTWGGQGLSASQQLSFGKTHLRQIDLSSRGIGWMVGERALIMKSENAGVTWEPPTGKLPPELRDVVDFYAVEQRNDHVWITGKPGTVIWHSSDGGNSWQPQFTGQSAPLRSIHFRDETHGIALGEFGTILITSDGGQTWNNQRAESPRRAGILVMTSSPDLLSFPLISWYAGENGYRTVVSLPVEWETNPDRKNQDLRLTAAVNSVGGNAAFAGSRLPLGLPDLQNHREQLIREWNARTDGRLQEVLLGGLVAEIRQFQPEVIVLSQPADNDQVGQLLNLAVQQAAKDAADNTRHVALNQHLMLQPWQVSRVVSLQPSAGPGGAFFAADRDLVRQGVTLGEAAERSMTRIDPQQRSPGFGEFHIVPNREPLQLSALFRDIRLEAGRGARRKLIPLTQEMLANDDPNPKRARQVSNMTVRARRQYGSAESVIGLLSRQLQGMDPEAAARMLLEMGREALAAGDLTAAEGIWIELVNNYDTTLAGQQGMKQLLRFWASEEIAWHRSRRIGSSRVTVSTNSESVLNLLENPTILKFSGEIYDPDRQSIPGAGGKSPVVQASSLEGSPVDWHTGVRERWLKQAGLLGIALTERNPALLRDDTVQRSLAVVNRHPQIAGEMDTLFQRTHNLPKGVPTNWFIPPREPSLKQTLTAAKVSTRPHLDGLLNDDCWQHAEPEVLKQTSGRLFADGASFIKMSHDGTYLYLAASLVMHPEILLSGPQPAGRHHDADLTGRDRVTFAFDIDRDHEFFYELTIDERGWTSETLGGLAVWNPRMFIATHHDAGHWRIEAAIPLKELAPPTGVPGHSWSLAIRRTLPTVGWESWQSDVSAETPTVKEFGRLQFK